MFSRSAIACGTRRVRQRLCAGEAGAAAPGQRHQRRRPPDSAGMIEARRGGLTFILPCSSAAPPHPACRVRNDCNARPSELRCWRSVALFAVSRSCSRYKTLTIGPLAGLFRAPSSLFSFGFHSWHCWRRLSAIQADQDGSASHPLLLPSGGGRLLLGGWQRDFRSNSPLGARPANASNRPNQPMACPSRPHDARPLRPDLHGLRRARANQQSSVPAPEGSSSAGWPTGDLRCAFLLHQQPQPQIVELGFINRDGTTEPTLVTVLGCAERHKVWWIRPVVFVCE